MCTHIHWHALHTWIDTPYIQEHIIYRHPLHTCTCVHTPLIHMGHPHTSNKYGDKFNYLNYKWLKVFIYTLVHTDIYINYFCMQTPDTHMDTQFTLVCRDIYTDNPYRFEHLHTHTLVTHTHGHTTYTFIGTYTHYIYDSHKHFYIDTPYTCMWTHIRTPHIHMNTHPYALYTNGHRIYTNIQTSFTDMDTCTYTSYTHGHISSTNAISEFPVWTFDTNRIYWFVLIVML